MCKIKTILSKKHLFSLNHQVLCWSPKRSLKVPWKSRTLWPLGDVPRTSPASWEVCWYFLFFLFQNYLGVFYKPLFEDFFFALWLSCNIQPIFFYVRKKCTWELTVEKMFKAFLFDCLIGFLCALKINFVILILSRFYVVCSFWFHFGIK